MSSSDLHESLSDAAPDAASVHAPAALDIGVIELSVATAAALEDGGGGQVDDSLGRHAGLKAGQHLLLTYPIRELADLGDPRLIALRVDGGEVQLDSRAGWVTRDGDGRPLLLTRLLPRAELPDGPGRHRLGLMVAGRELGTPIELSLPVAAAGTVIDHIEDGLGRLIIEIRGDLGALAATGEVTIVSAPAFGPLTASAQLLPAAETRPLRIRYGGHAQRGSVDLFDTWTLSGVRAAVSPVVLEIRFATRGTGLAGAFLGGRPAEPCRADSPALGWTRDLAFRADATVL